MIRSKFDENEINLLFCAPRARCLFISVPAIKAFFNCKDVDDAAVCGWEEEEKEEGDT